MKLKSFGKTGSHWVNFFRNVILYYKIILRYITLDISYNETHSIFFTDKNSRLLPLFLSNKNLLKLPRGSKDSNLVFPGKESGHFWKCLSFSYCVTRQQRAKTNALQIPWCIIKHSHFLANTYETNIISLFQNNTLFNCKLNFFLSKNFR